jgi:hypothetical protein
LISGAVVLSAEVQVLKILVAWLIQFADYFRKEIPFFTERKMDGGCRDRWNEVEKLPFFYF